MDARYVAETIIAAKQHNPTAERTFEQSKDVVTINPEFAPAKAGWVDAKSATALDIVLRTGIARHGHALTFGEAMTVADEVQCGARSVITIQQPAKIRGGGPQG